MTRVKIEKVWQLWFWFLSGCMCDDTQIHTLCLCVYVYYIHITKTDRRCRYLTLRSHFKIWNWENYSKVEHGIKLFDDDSSKKKFQIRLCSVIFTRFAGLTGAGFCRAPNRTRFTRAVLWISVFTPMANLVWMLKSSKSNKFSWSSQLTIWLFYHALGIHYNLLDLLDWLELDFVKWCIYQLFRMLNVP